VTATELARKVRLVELRARKTAGGLVSGAYHSAFKGQGVEFQEVREYVPGDDTRAIDWNVTARVGRPFIKRFAEERDQTVMLLVDGSRSNRIAGGQASKSDVVSEICAVLAFAAVHNKDATGLIMFTDDVELYVQPGRGVAHVLRIVRDVLAFQPRGKGTHIAGALEFLAKVQRRRSLVFLISDFLISNPQDRGYERALKIAGRRHDVIAFPVFDPREAQLPDCGLAEFADPETGERFLLDTADAAVQRAWHESAGMRAAELQTLFRAADIDHLRIQAGTDYLSRLIVFLRSRSKRD
jgi:uncharacterized protein (DUF58 family)